MRKLMMVGYYDWVKRNVRKMSEIEMKKTLKEAEELQKLIKINLKTRGVV
jgi:hypothetical protein